MSGIIYHPFLQGILVAHPGTPEKIPITVCSERISWDRSRIQFFCFLFFFCGYDVLSVLF